MNINGYTQFVLTKHGAQVWNRSRLPERASGSATVYTGDILREQLWVVMEVFGADVGEAAFAVNNELTVPEMPGATLPDAIKAGVAAAKPTTYPPETEAAASLKRMGAVVVLAADVESGEVSHTAAKLGLMAGGYGAEVLSLVDALKVQPSLLLSDECATRLHAAAEPGETIVGVLDRLIAGADDGAEVVS